jgi:hypothetical protein
MTPPPQEIQAIRQDEACPASPGPQPQAVASQMPAYDPIDPVFTDDLLHALAVALPTPERQTEGQQHRRTAAAVAALRSFDARDTVEAMLATHALLAHQFTMECYRRAARSSQTPNLNTRLLGAAVMLSRTMGGTLHMLEQRQEEPTSASTSVAGPGRP